MEVFMKKLLCILTAGFITLGSSNILLAESKVKFIKFVGTKTTLFGTKYKVYTVRCSNGKKGKISSWDDGKKWCVGESKSDCTNKQMDTAEKVCE